MTHTGERCGIRLQCALSPHGPMDRFACLLRGPGLRTIYQNLPGLGRYVAASEEEVLAVAYSQPCGS